MSRLNLNLIILGEILVSNNERKSIIFHHVQAKSELNNYRSDSGHQYWGWSQSSFTMSRLNLNLLILDKILVSNTGGQSYFTMSRLNLNLLILDKILVSNTGGQSYFTMSRLNLNLKVLGVNLVVKTGRSITFPYVQAKTELNSFRSDSGQ